MVQRNSLGSQIGGIWENGYDKEMHSVLALVIAKVVHGILIIVGLILWIPFMIFRPKTAREAIQTWSASRQANKQAAAEQSTE